MNKIALVATLLLGGAGLYTAASGYTGGRIASTLPERVAQGDLALQQALPGSRLTLERLERGLFSSTAHYQLSLMAPTHGGAAHRLHLTSTIEHGPLPRSRLLRLQWQPVLAFSRSQLRETPDTRAWFVATGKAQEPLSAELTLAYDGSYQGTLRIAPLDHNASPKRLRLAELLFNYRFSNATQALDLTVTTPSLILGEKGETLRLNGLHIALEGRQALQQIALRTQLDSLSISTRMSQQLSEWRLSALSLDSQRQRQPSGLYTGSSRLSIRQGELLQAKQSTWVHEDLQLQEQMRERDGMLEGSLEQHIAQIRHQGEAFASSRLRLSYSGLPSHWLLATPKTEQPSPDPAPVASSVPLRIALDEGRLASRHGLGLLSLEAELNPAQLPKGVEAVSGCPASRLQSLRGELSVDRALLVDLLRVQASTLPQSRPSEEQVQAQVDLLIQQALSSHMAVREGERLFSRLQYREGRLLLNGEPISALCPPTP
ncbi:DUF945 family protein [Pseudomonas sp. NW5]|uniref:YdgA family protein n=1 Tax=Pseudomonas sp. NW5 TaxID=2934934 RepID=UPI0020208861|nr:DUF945 family protein [Pseudomonas sp. NW5]MCL7462668.1 YdgA family protein [Pseudomonas sp. NW5]